MKKEIPGPEWKLLVQGETFMWISNEHCMLLTATMRMVTGLMIPMVIMG